MKMCSPASYEEKCKFVEDYTLAGQVSKGIIDEIKVGHGSDTIASTVIPAEAYLISRLELRPPHARSERMIGAASHRFGKNSIAFFFRRIVKI